MKINYVTEVCSRVNVYEQPYCFFNGYRAYPDMAEPMNYESFLFILSVLILLIILTEFPNTKLGKKLEMWMDKKEKEINDYHKNFKESDNWF